MTQIVGNGQFQAGVAGIYKPAQVKAINDHTVEITFTDPAGHPVLSPVSLENIKFTQFGIIDSVEAKKHVTSADPYATEWLQKASDAGFRWADKGKADTPKKPGEVAPSDKALDSLGFSDDVLSLLVLVSIFIMAVKP